MPTVWWGLDRPIERSEVDAAIRKAKDTAPGPDKVKLEHLKRADGDELTLWFNAFLRHGWTPAVLRGGIVTLIPKVDDATEPGQFRPITVTSLILRCFHMVLNSRLSGIEISERLKGYRFMDGTAQNVWLVRLLLDRARKEKKPLAMAFLDVAKAFDSVNHRSLLLAATRKGIPPRTLAYLTQLYGGARVRLKGDTEEIAVTRGVLQGDPLSGTLFNFVLEWGLEAVSTEAGVSVPKETGDGVVKIPYGSYADDTFLASDSPLGLSDSFQRVRTALRLSGLDLNPAKCRSVHLRILGRTKRFAVDTTPVIEGVEPLTASQAYKYLGTETSVECTSVEGLRERLVIGIGKLTKSPLKPQQRLHALRVHLFPALIYGLTLSKAGVGVLGALDKIVRVAVRKWLHMPKDVPTAFFYTKIGDGGLGLKAYLTHVRLMRIGRLERITLTEDEGLKALLATKTGLDLRASIGKVIKVGKVVTNSRQQIDSAYRDILHDSVDGKGLRTMSDEPRAQQWWAHSDIKMSGEEFVRANAIKIASLPTKVRSARGRPGAAVMCNECNQPANLSHCLQVCGRTAGLRTKRHNELVRGIKDAVKRKGFTVVDEPHIYLTKSRRRDFLKPDLVIFNKNRVIVLDPSIVADNAQLTSRYHDKIDKYKVDKVDQFCKGLLGGSGAENCQVEYHGLILTWRGAWERKSWKALRDLGISRRELAYITLRSMVNSWRIFHFDYRQRTN